MPGLRPWASCGIEGGLTSGSAGEVLVGAPEGDACCASGGVLGEGAADGFCSEEGLLGSNSASDRPLGTERAPDWLPG